MIERILAPAVASGVSTQVETHLVDLDGDWPSVAPDGADIAWASLSLHHTSNPARVLQQVFDLLRPGGVAVVTEFTGATRYSPTDLGTTSEGLGERIVAALAAQGYPVTADWAPQLAAAGFGPIERHESFVTVSAATSVGARFLELHLTRSRELLRPPA
ncbi:hypothetical protein AX769_05865 [Frondihabitans sp. PAMC 28766]|nr:hypothetical protein AX769_05865 [Frondihabitans sp. PAMC 28766]